MKALIVSRHKSTIELLSRLLEKHSIEFDVKDHVDVRDLENYDIVVGNLPLTYIITSAIPYYIQVVLEVPRELRGKELGYDELMKYCRFLVYEHLITFHDWSPKDKAIAVAEFDIWVVKDIDVALEEIKRNLQLRGER